MHPKMKPAGLLACMIFLCTGCSGSSSDGSRPAPGRSPVVALSAASTAVPSGTATMLSWSAQNADRCTASGAWSGARPTSGSESTGVLTAPRTYRLSCEGLGGASSAELTVNIGATPTTGVSLTAAEDAVDAGATTTLTWSAAAGYENCTASGDWSGAKASNGSETVGPITTNSSFTLNCSGRAGRAVAIASVVVAASLPLNWTAPSHNVDGSRLTDLAGYRIYYGQASRDYVASARVDDPAATSIVLRIPSGRYHVAMTAVNTDGIESGYSNEVLKETQ